MLRDFFENDADPIDRPETWLTNNGINIISFDVYFRELLNFKYLLCFSYLGFIKKLFKYAVWTREYHHIYSEMV